MEGTGLVGVDGHKLNTSTHGFLGAPAVIESVFSTSVSFISPHIIPQGSEMLNELYHSDAKEDI